VAGTAGRVKPAHTAELGWQSFGLFLAVGLFAFGMTSLSVRRRVREGAVHGWSNRLVLRALGSFFAGLALIPVLALVLDMVRS
jgi:hypothetical protein